MIYIIHLSLGLIVAKKNSTQLRGGVKNKVVLLGGAHHKVASPVVVKVPLLLWEIFYLLRIPGYGKIIEQIGK